MEVLPLVEQFSGYLAEDPNTSPRTAEFYEADLKEFARFLATRGVAEIEEVGVVLVMEFRTYLLERLRKLVTV